MEHRLPVFGLRVGTKRCASCPLYDGPARGVGDVIASAAKAVGIAPCGGCQKRREILNAALPLHMQRNNEISQDSAKAP
jgi:hypothetical protein